MLQDLEVPSPNLAPREAMTTAELLQGSTDFEGPEGATSPGFKTSLNHTFGSRTGGVVAAQDYAHHLMDELFVGVEHLLETGADLPNQREPDVIAVKPLNLPQITLPLTLIPPSVPPTSDDAAIDPEAAAALAEADRQGQRFTRWLGAAVLVSLVGAIAMGISQRDRYATLFARFTPQPIAAETLSDPALSVANQQFAEYVSRSLEVLREQQTAVTTLNTTSPAPNPQLGATTLPTSATGTLPSVTVAGTPGTGLGPSSATVPGATVPGATVPGAVPSTTIPGATVATALPPIPGTSPNQPLLERIYIPVYQTAQGFIPVVPGVPLPPAVVAQMQSAAAPTATTPATTSLGNGSPSTTSTAVNPANTANTTAPRATAPRTAPQPNPAPPAPAPVEAATATTPLDASPTGVAATHTLVGILDMQDSDSKALFDINSVTRRINIGERIGSSGWTLVDVKKDEAIIRRNGEVRSIFPGQTF